MEKKIIQFRTPEKTEKLIEAFRKQQGLKNRSQAIIKMIEIAAKKEKVKCDAD